MLPEHDGPTHPQIGASAACWALYGEVLAREYGELGYPECHRLTVDAYAVQHPGSPGRRAVQSLCTHLCGLYLVLEQGVEGHRATALIDQVLSSKPRFEWLDPPQRNGTLTVRHVLESSAGVTHCDAVETWARDLWAAWEPHHDTVRGWLRPVFEQSRQT